MKQLITLLAILVLVVPVKAQNSKPNEAEKLMERVSKKYKSYKSIKADFLFTQENKQQKSIDKQKGNILVKGNKFKLEIANQLIICDNKTMWTYSREVNEVQISNYSPKEGSIRMDDLFTMYGKGFLYKIIETKKEAGKEMVWVELTPKDKKKKFFKIKAVVEKTSLQLISSQIFEKNGSIQTYSVVTQTPNIAVADKTFTFDVSKYPGVEVIDLR